MTPDEYITLAGKYCERMEWNHDAIPELAECLEDHDKRLTAFLDGERIARQYAIDKGVELQRENFKMKEAMAKIASELEIENKTLRAQAALDHRAKGLMLMESQRQIDCILFVYSRDREIKCLSADEARDNQKQMFADGWKHTSTIHPARWIEALINHPEGLDAESTRLMDELQFGVS